MLTDWNAAIDFVLEMEGGYTFDKRDPGGETMFGITRRDFPNWEGWPLVDELKAAEGFPRNANVRAELITLAKDFFMANFWKVCRCDELPTTWAIALFDSAVNQGVSKAVRIMQSALNVVPDGAIGAQTIDAIHSASERQFRVYLGRRCREYHELMIAKPALQCFALDWFFRVISLSKVIFKQQGVV